MHDWWAEGLLFENCTCAAVCPGHIRFTQKCTRDPCSGYWAIRFEAGRIDGLDLAGVDAVVLGEAPRVMADGNWKQAIIVSDRATAAQQRAVEEILQGGRGGPWEVLARFVSERAPTRAARIEIEEAPTAKSVTVAGVLRGAIEAIRGRNRDEPVKFVNIYNQIHDSEQVIARGSTQCEDPDIAFATDETHGLWSRFRWSQ